MKYNLELERVVERIKRDSPSRVLIQLPEGMKTKSKEIMETIKEETNAEAVLDGGMIWGACCIPTKEEMKDYDLVLHFGHTEMIEAENTMYLPIKSNLEVHEVTKKAAEKAKGEKIGIVTLTQHLHKLPDMKKAVRELGKTPVTYPGNERVREAQVLGCSFDSTLEVKKADSLLFIGSGKFHPQGVANAVGTEIIQGNPYNGEVTTVKPGQWMKEKEIRKDKARNAKTFALITTKHPGQIDTPLLKETKKTLREKGKKVYEVKMTEITPNKVNYLPFDAFVINACPRIVLDDWKNYEKPILLPSEAKELVNAKDR